MFSHHNFEVICFEISPFPNGESFYWRFNNNKTFKDLKNDLDKKQKMKKETYYFEKNGHVINESNTLRREGITNDSCLSAIRIDCLNIIL